MTADQVIRLLTAIAGLLGVLVWPALVLFVTIRFRAPLSDFFRDLGEFSFKAPGLEASARRRQVEAAAALGAAVATRGGQRPGTANPFDVADALAEAVPDMRSQRRLLGRSVLWVDDRPDNNRYERRVLEALGVRLTTAASTEEAVDQLKRQSFDLIISDMGRPPDPRAGYTLLDELRSGGNHTPFVIYAGSRSPEHVKEARQRGALGCTNSPQELIQIVTQTLREIHYK
ncbi:response regulator [Actinoplanes aureus]|uniref:Response regulator n=1 Tax=Actinoplanes aureus TaxID=2792083 RepID=A0A931G3U3_9ACTN|nr:response regulator [Actinoplanes aureus]MBG0569247.1 response regulator [Actinoplanes aureus]